MIIEVRQTNANLKQEFEVYYDGNLQYTGRQSGLNSRSPSWLFHPDGSVRFKSSENKKAHLRNRIFSWLFTLFVLLVWLIFESVPLVMLAAVMFVFLFSCIPNTTKVCNIYGSSDDLTARFQHITKGFLTGYYSMECNNRNYQLYTLDRSHYQYVSVYLNGTQIAQINKDLHTVNNRDSYTLCLLDEEAALADLLTMFILYFDNYEHSNRNKVFVGSKKNWSWSFSKTDRFFNETWLPSHFGRSVAEDSGYLMK